MNRVEFKTTVHDGMIEIPKDNPEIKDREVKVVIMWEEKPDKGSSQKSTSNLEEVFGLWKGKDISLDKVRTKQWERKGK
ncbi:MAG: hypothetical protein WCL14_10445 [Bacteroidota bacterium]